MKPLVVGLAGMAGIAGSGCVPMEQASLTYISAQKVGVGVTAGPADGGLDVTIGYKGVDAAYVPVAVAKHCRKGDPCGNVNYNPFSIRGDSSISDEKSLNAQMLDEALKDLKAAEAAYKTQGEDLAALDVQITYRGSLASKTTTRDIIAAVAEDVRTQEQKDQLGALNADINRIAQLPDLDARKRELDRQRSATAATIADKKLTVKELQARQNESSADTKNDAFSVYGNFTANPEASRQGASISLGKVFSTGVAAQFLTQGVRDAARSNAIATCMATGSELLKELPAATPAEQAERANRLAKLCGLDIKP